MAVKPIIPRLTSKQIDNLRKVIERCDGLECGTIQPGIDAGLPFSEAHAKLTAQRNFARALLGIVQEDKQKEEFS